MNLSPILESLRNPGDRWVVTSDDCYGRVMDRLVRHLGDGRILHVTPRLPEGVPPPIRTWVVRDPRGRLSVTEGGFSHTPGFWGQWRLRRALRVRDRIDYKQRSLEK